MSSPAMSPDSPRRSLLQHPRAVVKLIDPMTGETIDTAKAQQRKEQVYALADIRAGMDDVILRTATPDVRAAYLEAAGQFREPMKGLLL